MNFTNIFILVISLTFCFSLSANEGKDVLRIVQKYGSVHLKINLTKGDISIIGYEGDTVNVVTNSSDDKYYAEGGWGAIMNVRKNNDFIELSGKRDEMYYSLTIHVPFKTELVLNTVESKKISVEGIEGSVEVNSGNAALELKYVKCPTVVTVGQGRIVAWMSSFSKENIFSLTLGYGDINVNLDDSADLLLDIINHNGELFSDFSISPQSGSNINFGNSWKTVSTKGGIIKNGTSKLMLNSFDGDIYLKKIRK